MMDRSVKKSRKRGLVYLLIIPIVVVTGFPFYWMVNTALTSEEILFSRQQDLFPTGLHFAELAIQLARVPVLGMLANSTVIAVGTAALTVALSLFAAYALSRFRFHGKGVVAFLLFATQMVPAGIYLIPIYTMLLAIGLLDNLWGLVLVNTTFALPVSTFIIKAGLDSIPFEIDEAARIDNCPRLGILTIVLVPLVLPSIASAAVLAFFVAWGELMFAATYINTQSLWPASVWLSALTTDPAVGLPAVMTVSVLYSIPAIVFFHLVQRRIVSGLTAGSVKG
jgi:multiple sugar transport system permease protein